jgi:hypothetical protein
MLDKSTILAIDWGGHALNFLAFVSLTWDTILCVCVCVHTLAIFFLFLSHSRIKIDILIQLCETMGECIYTHQTNYWAPPLAIERLGFWLWEETHHYEHHITHIDRLPTFPFIGWTTFHLDSTLHNFKTNQNPGQLILGLMETFFFPLSTQHNTIPKQTKNPVTLFFLPLW